MSCVCVDPVESSAEYGYACMNTGQVRWWEEKVERDGYSAERLPGKRDTDRQCEGEHAEKRMRRARNSKSKYTERI